MVSQGGGDGRGYRNLSKIAGGSNSILQVSHWHMAGTPAGGRQANNPARVMVLILMDVKQTHSIIRDGGRGILIRRKPQPQRGGRDFPRYYS
jgi:hypothetical protein